ncbi:acetate--CoA ligase [Natranaerofaba carboxydovora]|uniref:acetate--CoA ligase n=1 Tax=Natranaerofaba carboxydovora TaxID=2742683 RepID=UPI001F132708|nr:acetate--CoA ligase [Natranaerofaba carboxydovora]UMZ74611.1 Acetyl-coenzyme A synthetase [Natranaerofaba carboxydovora]
MCAEFKEFSEKDKINPPKEFVEKANLKSYDEYKKMYEDSVKNREDFWARMAEEKVDWFKKWDKVNEEDLSKGEINWFVNGKLNVSYNCLDRHLKTHRRNKAAIIWEGDEGESKTYTYQQLHQEVCKFANVLKAQGVKKGDRVAIYLPMVPELPVAMLACARIGAIHSIIFAGFSPDSIKDRVLDCEAKVIITSDESVRGGKIVPLKDNVDKAAENLDVVEKIIVLERTSGDINMKEGRDVWWHEEMKKADDKCEPEEMDAEDPLFILYTSGSTGKPKGVLHTTGGYLLYTQMTTEYIFDIKDDDVYWCTADIGWITGHSYIVYGPLASGATTLVFEGVPTYPEPDRFWQVVEKYKVNIFYTAPTALRALKKAGDEWIENRDLSSLRLLGTVGEPINPEVWSWYHYVIGQEKCPIVDTWWQTETGGILISPIPGAIPTKPGYATVPFFGVEPLILKDENNECDTNETGFLVINKSWPSMLRGVYGDHERFMNTYLKAFPGYYMTGDGAFVDEDGYVRLTGRIDDVINVSGHRMGTAEVESALVEHDAVVEAAVVGVPHDVKGEGIYAYCILSEGYDKSGDLKKDLINHVRDSIGPIAKPEDIHFVDGLPKTRSGKIMRRILRKVAEGETDKSKLGDTTTLAEPEVVDHIIDTKGKF